MKIFYFILFLILLPFNILISQIDSSDIITEDLLDNIIDESDEENDNTELFDVVEELIRNPIDINSARLIDFTKLPNIDQQIAQRIINHRNKFGYFYSTNELFAIREIDKQTIRNILPFIKAIPPRNYLQPNKEDVIARESFINNSHLFLRSRITNDLQNRDGFLSGKYNGSKLKSYNRLIYNYGNHYQLGILAEKDPGENSYTDFTTFHLQIKDFGLLDNFVGGDYVLEYGQGLALWSPFGFSKGADAIYPVKKKATYLRPYTSSFEYRYFRGAAAMLQFLDFNFTAFYSFNTFDATIDSITGEITSFGQTGFHRFESELDKKGAGKSKSFGAVLDYHFKERFNLGLIYYNAKFDNSLSSESVYDLSGDNFNYLSTYYDFNFSNFNIFGEFSYDGTSVASINGFQLFAARDFIFTTSIRNYPRNYHNLYGFGFSEKTGRINNEVGIYSGLKWRLPFGIVNFYYDIFKFPYKTTENSLSSEGDEFLLDFITKPFFKFEARVRYKYENKEITEQINFDKNIVRRLKQIIRTEFVYDLSNSLRFKTRFEYNHLMIKDAQVKEDGFLMFQDIRYIPQKYFILYGRIIFFQTDSFNSAIYEFENDLLGVMPNLALYGKGMRMYFIIKYRALNFLSISAKYSETYKPDETSLSSGDNEIIGNLDNRFSLQIDLSF